ncbi:MAG: DNA gyrase C-terminal beta-propeller domain-containing protein, partial [Lacisediminihabitans sp.]
VVKRVSPGFPSKPSFDVISLKTGDEVIGVTQSADDQEFVFISSDARLLRFAASTVRPQGASASGMAGINLSAGATAIFFGAVDASTEAVVATISSSSATIEGTDPGRVKVSHFSEFPAKGRATGGVRAHAFLKGEDILTIAWAGPAPAVASGPDGAARQLPDAGAKRDASGTPIESVIGSIGTSL